MAAPGPDDEEPEMKVVAAAPMLLALKPSPSTTAAPVQGMSPSIIVDTQHQVVERSILPPPSPLATPAPSATAAALPSPPLCSPSPVVIAAVSLPTPIAQMAPPPSPSSPSPLLVSSASSPSLASSVGPSFPSTPLTTDSSSINSPPLLSLALGPDDSPLCAPRAVFASPEVLDTTAPVETPMPETIVRNVKEETATPPTSAPIAVLTTIASPSPLPIPASPPSTPSPPHLPIVLASNNDQHTKPLPPLPPPSLHLNFLSPSPTDSIAIDPTPSPTTLFLSPRLQANVALPITTATPDDQSEEQPQASSASLLRKLSPSQITRLAEARPISVSAADDLSLSLLLAIASTMEVPLAQERTAAAGGEGGGKEASAPAWKGEREQMEAPETRVNRVYGSWIWKMLGY